jgi:hypothetical protein
LNRLELAGRRAPVGIATVVRDLAHVVADARFYPRASFGWITLLATFDHAVATRARAVVVLRRSRFTRAATIVWDHLRDLYVDAARRALTAGEHVLGAQFTSAAAFGACADPTECDRDVAAFERVYDSVATRERGEGLVIARVVEFRGHNTGVDGDYRCVRLVAGGALELSAERRVIHIATRAAQYQHRHDG